MPMGEHIGSIASLIGSLTVVGSALLWIYNTFIGKPREQRRQAEEEKRQEQMLQVVKQESGPLNKSIQQLTEWLNESKADRESLNKISKENSKRLDEHERRIDVHQDAITKLEVGTKFMYDHQNGR